MSKKGGALKTVSMMMIITLSGKILGLLRDSFVGSHYGTASIEGAAFNYATLLPRQFLDVMFASVISASFIPVFNAAMERKKRDEAYRLSYNFISIILSISTAVTLVCILLAGPITRLYLGGEMPEAIPLATVLIRIMFPIMIISGLAFSLTGILQSMGEFNIPAAMGLVANSIILIYFIFFMKTFGVVGLCVAYLLGWLSQFLIQLPFLAKNQFRFRFFIDLKDEGIRQIVGLMLPVMVSTWVAPVNVLVNGKAALQDAAGTEAFNAINLANGVYTVIAGVFILSVTNIIFPRLSVLAANHDEKNFGSVMRQTIRALFFFLLPMSLGLIGLSHPIVRLVYERDNFTAHSTDLTAAAMCFFSVGIVGFGLQNVLTRGFYASLEGKTPMLIGLLAMAVNLVLSFGLIPILGVGGPALASSVSVTLSAVLMLVLMYRKNKGVFSRAILGDIVKMLGAGLVMLLLVILLRDALTDALADTLPNRLLIIGLPVLAGVCVYMGITFILRLEEAKIAFGILRSAVHMGRERIRGRR